jgi:hypothetical protein
MKLADAKVSVRVKLSALWASVEFLRHDASALLFIVCLVLSPALLHRPGIRWIPPVTKPHQGPRKDHGGRRRNRPVAQQLAESTAVAL